MLRNRIYYLLKPYIPWGLRMALRRWRALRRRAALSHVWPIDPNAGCAPEGWPGWPEGKRFAFVLSHDVESALGVQRTPALMELEASLGFRSSFNFVPAGSYTTPKELRDRLNAGGFEVGVHDLHHDG